MHVHAGAHSLETIIKYAHIHECMDTLMLLCVYACGDATMCICAIMVAFTDAWMYTCMLVHAFAYAAMIASISIAMYHMNVLRA